MLSVPYRRELEMETERRKNAEIIVVRTKEQLSRQDTQYQQWAFSSVSRVSSYCTTTTATATAITATTSTAIRLTASFPGQHE